MIAESDRCETVDGHAYFAPDAVRREFLAPSETRTACGWKGVARYFHVVVDGEANRDAAWCYPEAKPAASKIRGHIAFWRGVRIEP